MKKRALLLTITAFSTVTLFAQLSGTYTVGGSNPDYNTLTNAVNDLNSMGAAGDVIFNLRPGTYTAKYELGVVSGTPGDITIKSESNDPNDVVLAYDATDASDNYVILVDGTEDLTLQALTFAPLDFTYSGAVIYRNNAHFLHIDNCVFIGSQNNSGSGYFRRILLFCDQNNVGTPDNPDNVSITNNTFMYGNTAMNLEHEGFGGSRAQNLLVDGNRCIDQSGTGIWIDHAANSVCSNNLIKTDVGVWFTGIKMFHFESATVSGNRVEAYSTNSCTAFEYSNNQNTSGNLIKNNMFYAYGTGETWGLAVFNLWGTRILNNTAVADGGTAEDSYVFYHLSSFSDGEDTELKNNIFANYTGGKALYTKVPTNVNAEDFDVLFTSGDTLTGFGSTGYETLGDHQTGTGFGVNSVSLDPAFPHLPDLHLNSCVLEGLGDPDIAVTQDLDGDVRDATNPDMGADEFTFSSGTIVGSMINITGADLPYTLSAPNGTAFNWSTGDLTQETMIAMSGTYTCAITDINGCSYTISITVDVDISTSLEALKGNEFNVFPNPASDVINIRYKGGNEVKDYTLISTDGRSVASGSISNNGWIDVSGIQSGIYMLGLFQGEGMHWKKVMIVE